MDYLDTMFRKWTFRNWLYLRYLQELALETLLSNCIFKCLYRVIRGVARIFQRRGHRGYSPECLVDLHTVHVLLNVKKTNFKKVGFSTMAFTAKILSWRFRHLNIVGCLLQRRPTKGGSQAPQDPPLAMHLVMSAECSSETCRPF